MAKIDSSSGKQNDLNSQKIYGSILKNQLRYSLKAKKSNFRRYKIRSLKQMIKQTKKTQFLEEKAYKNIKICNANTLDNVKPQTTVAQKYDKALNLTIIEHDDSIGEFYREKIGGKGAALKLLENAGIPVPLGVAIPIKNLKEFEDQPLDVTELKQFIPDIETLNLSVLNITSIKDAIKEFYIEDPSKKDQYLQGLEKFIGSEQFYQQMKNLPAANHIREVYKQLNATFNNDPTIVRSSGILEDNLGNAQAGKFESMVNSHADIVHTSLRILASAFRPGACNLQQLSQPAMSIILQKCINCKQGGVAMSRGSFQNDSIIVESGPGQPQGVVSGQSGVIPNKHIVSRSAEDTVFIKGNITSQFVLQAEGGDAFSEQKQEVSAATIGTLTPQHLAELKQHILKIENFFLCPVDVEFAIDQQDKLFILQARPITRLSGGMDFSIDPPINSIIDGTLVSEGRCSGVAVYVQNQQDTQNIPKGAIVVARYGQEWMLESEFLEKVSGFVFEQGGTNDHVAITLRQEAKPCLIAKDQLEEITKINQTVTLACGNFNDKPGAYVTLGKELDEQLSTLDVQSKVSTMWHSSSTIIDTEPFRIELKDPATIYNDLNKLNYILLDNFEQKEWIDRCFSATGIQELCMAPYRKEIIKEAIQFNAKMLNNLEEFLKGYHNFLLLGIKENSCDQNTALLKKKLATIPQLQAKLQLIKSKINKEIQVISEQLNSTSQQLLTTGDFKQLLSSAESISNTIQKLNIPKSADGIESVHDVIFWIHKNFTDALAPVAINSGFGEIKRTSSKSILITFSKNEEQIAMGKACSDGVKSLDIDTKVAIMDKAIITSLELGVHAATIELIDEADGGKGSVVKLKFSDDFSGDRYYQGKLKRSWFLTNIMHNAKLDINSTGFNASICELTGILTIEYSHVKNKDKMLSGYKNIISIISKLKDIDMDIQNQKVSKNYVLWNFDILRQKINSFPFPDQQTQDEFKFHAFMLGYSEQSELYSKKSELFSIKSDEILQKFLKIGIVFDKLRQDKKAEETFNNMLKEASQAEQEELLYYGLLAENRIAIKLVKLNYPSLLEEIEKVLNILAYNGNIFNYLPDDLYSDNKEIPLAAVTNKAEVFNNLTRSLQDSRDIAEAAVNNNGMLYSKLSKHLQKDIDIARAAIKNTGNAFSVLRDEFKNYREFALKAVKYNGFIFVELNDKFQNDRGLALEAVKSNYEVFKYLNDEFKNDTEIISAAISRTSSVLQYLSDKFKNNENFILKAIQNNKDFEFEYIDEKFRDNEKIVIVALLQNGILLKDVSDRLKDNPEIVSIAVNNAERALQYASDRLKNDENIVLISLDKDTRNFDFISEKLTNDIDFLTRTINLLPNVFRELPSDLQKNPKIIQALINSKKFDLSEIKSYVIFDDSFLVAIEQAIKQRDSAT